MERREQPRLRLPPDSNRSYSAPTGRSGRGSHPLSPYPARLSNPLQSEPRNDAVFDYSTALAPRSKPATAFVPKAAPLSIDDEIARHQTVSVSRDGKVETTKLPDDIKQRIIQAIHKINQEKKAKPANASPSQGSCLYSE